MTIDLNCDMGELADPSIEEAIMPHITSANVACGAHAGDPDMMRRTVELARRYGVGIGAHPGYPDRANFGRLELPMTADEIAQTVCGQIQVLAAIAPELSYVKPHGALYNVAARNPAVAEGIARGVRRWGRDVVLVGLAGSQMLDLWRALGFRVAAEAFADRRYEPDGSLRARKFPDALILDPAAAVEQALRLSSHAQTICIHSDTPGAVRIVQAVAAGFRAAGVTLKPLAAAPAPPAS
ncbi:MAG TPA: 5-oxoprolinase subunit PxpA [Bryobacteraceae bacterium]|nr:5-oxoprolinase subunit PxpA [Bryobacteraceae bacterium]